MSKPLLSPDTLVTLSLEEQEVAISKLQKFLQFETVSSTASVTGAYVECAAFLMAELQSLGFLSDIHLLPEAPDHSPVVVACWKGYDETLPVILLNSHYDVVPALVEDWTVPPFAGLRRDGKIYGRGSQDMKCVCLQYLLAIQKIHQLDPEWKPARSIWFTYVPDEEVGGGGMAAFLESNLYQNVLPGISIALDEGLASTNGVFSLYYGERLPWWIDVTAVGPTGHGSRFIDNTAVEQLIDLANKALAFRKGQRDLLGLDDHSNCAHAVAAAKKKTLGDVTSLNITTLQAGVKVADHGYAYNCVPPKAICSLDIRISPHTQPQEIGKMLDDWCRDCSKDPANGAKVTWKYIGGHGNDLQQHATTSTDANSNPWFDVISQSLERLGMSLDAQVFPAATDSRFLRALGIRAFGFSPMRNTEIMLHENDEYIPEATYLEGISVYVALIHAMGSQGDSLR